jgi:peptidoglycan/LPS O-acetylase OafA/YrhL
MLAEEGSEALSEVGTHKTEQLHGHHGLRGVAAITVVAMHWDVFVKLGFPGLQWLLTFWADDAVDLFFLLSGFIFAYVYGQAACGIAASERIDWRSFYLARFARIYPVYFVTILFVVVIEVFDFWRNGVRHHELSLESVASNLMCVQAWYGDATGQSINMPSWSVSVEVFLYGLVFPVLMASCGRNLRVSTLVTICMLIACGVAVAACYTGGYLHAAPRPLVRGAAGFLGGFLLCARLRRSEWTVWCPSLCIFAGCAITFTIGYFRLSAGSLIGKTIFWLGLCVIVYGSFSNASRLAKVFSLPFFVMLGTLSYSMYLWHIPVGMAVSGLVKSIPVPVFAKSGPGFVCLQMIALSIASAASYFLLEAPLRKSIRKWGRPARKLAQAQVTANAHGARQ